MSDLLINISQASLWGICAIGFTAGLAGSLHCVGMCGAFATSCSQSKEHLFSYHLGKMTSYALLGGAVGLIGSSFTYLTDDPYMKVIPSILMGLFFIFIGIKSLKRKRVSIPLPQKIQRKAQGLMVESYSMRQGTPRSFSLGFLSALLPCGLLYGVLFSFAVLQNPFSGAIGMLSFGLGTIPALTIAPTLLTKIIKPLKEEWPKLTSLGLISLGFVTITYRMVIAYGQASCH